MPRLLTIDEAAARLRISPWTLRRWAAAGRVPVARPGRRLLFDEAALAEAISRASRPAIPIDATAPAA